MDMFRTKSIKKECMMKRLFFLIAVMTVLMISAWDVNAKNKGEPFFGSQTIIEYNIVTDSINNAIAASDSGIIAVSVRHNTYNTIVASPPAMDNHRGISASTTQYISCGECVDKLYLNVQSYLDSVHQWPGVHALLRDTIRMDADELTSKFI